MNRERSARLLRTILAVIIAALVIPLCALDRSARSQVWPSLPSASQPMQISATAPGTKQAGLRTEANAATGQESPLAERLPQGQPIGGRVMERSLLWFALLGSAVVVLGGLVVRALRAQRQRIRKLEAKLEAVETGLTAKVALLEEHLRRDHEHGRPRERI